MPRTSKKKKSESFDFEEDDIFDDDIELDPIDNEFEFGDAGDAMDSIFNLRMDGPSILDEIDW